jgi:hypothetical protein
MRLVLVGAVGCHAAATNGAAWWLAMADGPSMREEVGC